MALSPHTVKAVFFDYGNTLIAFGREQVDAFDRSLRRALEELYGPMDTELYNAQRHADRMAPYAGNPPEYRESDVLEMTANLVRRVYGKDPGADTLNRLLRVRRDAFTAVVGAEAHVFEMLDRLKNRYRLGLLSNYPDGGAIRESLDNTGLRPYFERVAVSGDIGLCKPHPAAFAAALEGTGLAAAEVVYVGDNWLADVQGAKRIGMQMVHFRRWTPPEHFERQPGDLEPDATLDHLSGLAALLGA